MARKNNATISIRISYLGQKPSSLKLFKNVYQPEMTSDPGIICYQHCKQKIFCLALPMQCPICLSDLINTNFKLMPFRLPFPFVKAFHHPCSIVLRPTTGDFLNEYFNCTDLHIAVTTSSGIIVEFDKYGLTKSTNSSLKTAWSQCLLVQSLPESWSEHWDNILAQICEESIWSSANYREDSHNCYSFVLKFLQALNYGTLSKLAFNRNSFCENYIVPRTTAAGKYISLYRKIRSHNFYIHYGVDHQYTKQNS